MASPFQMASKSLTKPVTGSLKSEYLISITTLLKVSINENKSVDLIGSNGNGQSICIQLLALMQ